ncbi:hypothetical protein H310_12885 [Aphanomyces invadans]|nr:hypothetical protein H310_12885 [Aphanomyces invadans]ETV93090.1 hypothetical protein H310_12885 [Aphanomyces invadans]|eukprot:XP_008878355.1 hypothetical protein H310_12885 [Aphanomyces invadans]
MRRAEHNAVALNHAYVAQMQVLAAKMEWTKRAVAEHNARKAAAVRLRGKLNQRRYRAERERTLRRLEHMIHTLHLEVARMEGRVELYHVVVPAMLRTYAPEFQLARENYRLFAHGYCVDPTHARHQAQVGYLNSAMSEDLVMMGSVGRDKLFDQWAMYMTTFGSIAMDLLTLDAVSFSPNVVIHAQAVMHLRLTRVSIELLFPVVRTNEPLVHKLVGKVLHLPMQMRFHFDRHGVVQELGTHARTTEALVDVLENVEEAVAVLGAMQLTEDAEIVAPSAVEDR